ncbi:hypothetical protein KC19_1G282300 [Ceratodon purpureus]|uniref:Uncharacterized protein n=1 Tax=Ceratodon purpureus TaxID=3225 RepID=A0A8T0JBY1_CERPU|nr:hypothetical protein KC19_1G282300 [Ceratodon purpureus]
MIWCRNHYTGFSFFHHLCITALCSYDRSSLTCGGAQVVYGFYTCQPLFFLVN